jgi:hypothetical protein
VCSEKMAMECRQVSRGEREGETVKLVRNSGRVLNGAPQSWAGGKGSSSGRQTSAGCGRAERRDFPPSRFCGRSRADLLLERKSAALLPSCARPTIYPEGQTQKSIVLSSYGGSYC